MAQHSIALITDSTCDIPPALVNQYGITVLSHVIIWRAQQYRDKTELQPEEFYRRLKSEKELPTTSQASAHDFASLYEQVCRQGAREIVVITVSSKFSGTILSAQQAAEQAEVPVYIHDLKAATMSLGWQVLAAARAREAGATALEMVQAADQVRQKVQLFICLDTLEYLYRGGRIGNARRLIGKMLNVKPLIYVDHSTGIVEPGGMAMTRRKGIEQMVQKFISHVGTDGLLHVAVMHGNAAGDAADLAERMQQEYHPVELFTNITGPALGINTGPLAVALAGYVE